MTAATGHLRILFRGELQPGASRDAAESFLASTFQLDASTLERVMSGRKVALRTGLSEDEAYALQTRLDAAGLVTRIERMKSVDTPDTPPIPAARPAAMAPAAPTPLTVEPLAPTPPRQPTGMPAFSMAEAVAARADLDGPVCPGCLRPLRASALHCHHCGTRVRKGGRVWLLYALVGLTAMVAGPVLVGSQLAGKLSLPDMGQMLADPAGQALAGHEHALAIQGKVRDFVSRTGFWPNSNLDTGLGDAEQLGSAEVARITIGANALMTLHFRDELAEIGGHSLAYVPERDAQGLPSWRCEGGTLPDPWRPADCQGAEPAAVPAPASEAAQGLQDMFSLPAGRSTVELPPEAFTRRVLGDELDNTRRVRDMVLDYRRQHGQWPAGHDAMMLRDPYQLGSHAVRQIRVLDQGRILYEWSAGLQTLQGETLTLVYDTSRRRWFCDSDIPGSHLPDSCRDGLE